MFIIIIIFLNGNDLLGKILSLLRSLWLCLENVINCTHSGFIILLTIAEFAFLELTVDAVSGLDWEKIIYLCSIMEKIIFGAVDIGAV